MKKTTKILLLTFFLIGANVIEAYCSCIITVHIARKRDCKGFGWCKMQIVIEDDGGTPTANRGIATADINDEGHFYLTINKKKDISPEAYEMYFSKGIFICEDDFPIPQEILKTLNYLYPYTIKAGNYPIKMRGDNMTIEF